MAQYLANITYVATASDNAGGFGQPTDAASSRRWLCSRNLMRLILNSPSIVLITIVKKFTFVWCINRCRIFIISIVFNLDAHYFLKFR